MNKFLINLIALLLILAENQLIAQTPQLRSLTEACSVERENYALINSFKDVAVISAGCKIKELLPTTDQTNFDVFHTDLYPIMAFAEHTKGYGQSFTFSVNKADQAKPYYILVVVEYDENKNVSAFRVRMKLPQTGAFANLQTVQREVIENSVISTMNSTYKADVGVSSQVAIQAGLNKLAEMLANVLAGRPMELNTAMLEQLGFSVILPNVTLTRTGGNGAGGDYAGLKYNFGGTEGEKPIMPNFSTANNSQSFSVQPFVTDKDNYTSPTKEFEQAATAFEASTSPFLVLWLHYQDGTLYGKWKLNATEAQIEALALEETNQLFADPEIEEPPAQVSRPNQRVPELRSGCTLSTLFNFSSDWRFDKNVRPCLSRFDSLLVNNTLGVDLVFKEGLVFGVADGVLDLMAFLYEMGSFAITTSTHTPFTVLWFADLAKETAKKGVFKGVKDKLAGDIKYWDAQFKAAIEVFKSLSTKQGRQALIDGIYNSLKEFVSNLAGFNGPYKFGYEWGKLVFEVALDFLTGGSNTLAKLATQLAKETFAIFAKDGIKAATQYVLKKGWEGSKNAAKKLKCLLKGGCFTPDTPYRSFSGLQPIQNAGIRPNLDYILNH